MAHNICLLYTSDAADERSSVDLGGRRIIKKKQQSYNDIDSTIKSIQRNTITGKKVMRKLMIDE